MLTVDVPHRNEYFNCMFRVHGMHECGKNASGQDIMLEGVSASAFRVLLEFLYAYRLPEDEESLRMEEMALVADRFQVMKHKNNTSCNIGSTTIHAITVSSNGKPEHNFPSSRPGG